MKNIIFLDYDSNRTGEELRIGKPNYTPTNDSDKEAEELKIDIDLLVNGLLKLVDESHKLGYLDKSNMLDYIISKLVKEKYDKSGESEPI
jgi:hypothetical protein